MPHVYGARYSLIRTIKAFNQFTLFQPVFPKQQFNQFHRQQQQIKFAAQFSPSGNNSTPRRRLGSSLEIEAQQQPNIASAGRSANGSAAFWGEGEKISITFPAAHMETTLSVSKSIVEAFLKKQPYPPFPWKWKKLVFILN